MKRHEVLARTAVSLVVVLLLSVCSNPTSSGGKGNGSADDGNGVETVTLLFDSQGGTVVAPQAVLHGATATEPVDLTYGELIFSGWYTEPECEERWDFVSSSLSDDLTLYAKWNEADSLAFTEIDSGTAYEVAEGTGSVDEDLYIPAYYQGVPVRRVASYGFRDHTEIVRVALPEGIRELGRGSFWGCTSLTTAGIPETVTTVEEYVFYGCETLGDTVYIPRNVESVAYNAFWYCYSLVSIEVDPQNSHYSSIDGVLFDASAETLLRYPCGKPDSTYSIPPTVTAVGDLAFSDNQHVTGVSVPESVESIAYCAFSNCGLITSFFIPVTVTTVGALAFGGSWAIPSIHCEAESKPDGWDDNWDGHTNGVTWGCSS